MSSRNATQAGALATDAALVMMRHDLGVGRDGCVRCLGRRGAAAGADVCARDSAARLAPAQPAGAAAAALRMRRDAAWQARPARPYAFQRLILRFVQPSPGSQCSHLPPCALRCLSNQDIMARGTDASGVGWLLRGFFQDHARQMDSDELAELETILRCSSDALASYILRTPPLPPPAHVAALPAWRLLVQYHRFWGGAGHEPGGEYV